MDDMKLGKWLVWVPRVLGVLYAAFLALFALDVFGENYTLGGFLLALTIHLIPSIAILAALSLSWKRPGAGAVLFTLLGIASVVVFESYLYLGTFLFVSLPVFIIALIYCALFVMKHWKEQGHAGPTGVLKDYIDYLTDNPKRYWFKRKLYGWGWTPATWEGWLVIVFFLGAIIWNAFRIDGMQHSVSDSVMNFVPQTVILVGILIGICFWKGEPPKWMWGLPKKKEKNPEM
jgi:hypothetical protein